MSNQPDDQIDGQLDGLLAEARKIAVNSKTVMITLNELGAALREHEGETIENGAGMALVVFIRVEEHRRAAKGGQQ